MAPTGANVSVGGKGLLGSVGRVVADRATVVTHEEASRVLVVITHDVDRALVIPPGALVERISHLDEVTLPEADQCLSSAGRSVHPREDDGLWAGDVLFHLLRIGAARSHDGHTNCQGAATSVRFWEPRPEPQRIMESPKHARPSRPDSSRPSPTRSASARRHERRTPAVALTETRRRGTSSGAVPTPRGKISVEPARRGAELVVVAR